MTRQQQILATQPTVDGWVARGRTLEEPQPGSELETDDRIWPERRVSETARLALIAASEHLQLVCAVASGPRGYATATHTVLRGGLLGAATAVWILGPDDPHERQQRALRSMTEWYRRIKQFGELSRPMCTPVDLSTLDGQIQAALEQERKSKAMWRKAASLSEQEPSTDTKVIGWVADFLFAKEPDKAATVRRQWAEHSGDAHALGWQLLARRSSPMVREPSGHRVTTTEGGVEQLADPYLAAFTILKRGWAFFDQRCTAP